MSIKDKLELGNFYTKKHLSDTLDADSIQWVREGIHHCKKLNSIFLFVDLVKIDKPDRFQFNDFFEGDYFHWDSQPNQHINTPTIQQIVNKEKEVHLFCREFRKIKSKTQPFIYCGPLEYFTHDKKTSKPIHIIFQALEYDDDISNDNLLNLYIWSPYNVDGQTRSSINMSQEISSKRINSYKKPNKTERKGLVTNRIGQGWYRLEVLKRWNSKCAVTNCGIEKILIASHIVAWKESNNSERLDVGNGILLCPNIDSLFDKHFISR